MIEPNFEPYVEVEKPEPLRMEHFLLPFGILVVGLLISLSCFLAEIIIHQMRKSKIKTDVNNIEDIEET